MDDQRAEDRLLSNADKASSEADQGGSDTDQALSDTDEAYADRDQQLSDRDQATADREHDGTSNLSAAGERAYREARTEREDHTEARRVTRQTRQRTSKERGGSAELRDRVADRRDEVGAGERAAEMARKQRAQSG